MATTNKGFIKDYQGNILLPITRGELLLDASGNLALTSAQYAVGATGPDGKQNLFGLMSLAEKQMLTGSTSGQSITDIYDKLGFINDGIKVGSNTTLHFYDDSKTGDERYTPITIQGSANRIAISATGNVITADLATITVDNANSGTANYVVKSVTVDSYGRVTSVANAKLTDSEIPSELTGKTLTNAILSGAKTQANLDENSDSSAVANKKYVDDKFDLVNNIATGALHFVGPLAGETDASNILKAEHVNGYFKVTQDFHFNVDKIHQNTQPATDGRILIKKGDTLIVYYVDSTYKFVHIPAGDDITTISFKENGTEVSNGVNLEGNVVFNFNDVFDLVGAGGKQVNITLPEVTNTTDGYLSAANYKTIMDTVANFGKTVYTETVTSASAGAYKLGTITVGNQDYDVHGQNNISALTLENGTGNVATNPVLKFVESGVNGATKNITIEGSNGIKAEKSGDVIKLAGTYSIDTNSKDYLTLTGSVLSAKLGSGSSESVTEGLTKYSEFIVVKENVDTLSLIANRAQPIILSNSLLTGATGSDGVTYMYGNDKLVTAITLTI